MLEVINITKKFGDFIAIDNISFKVNPGNILGILGRNGAGKSTIFRSILNIYDIDKR
jgi:ABC-2 type transport system ATP-binding protein